MLNFKFNKKQKPSFDGELLGIYKVTRNKNVFLLECYIDCSPQNIDMMSFTQKIAGVPKSSWQAPYDEKYLNENGDAVIGGMFDGNKLSGKTTRVCFYMFYLDINRPLLTPFGSVTLPEPIDMPKRLYDITKDDSFDD